LGTLNFGSPFMILLRIYGEFLRKWGLFGGCSISSFEANYGNFAVYCLLYDNFGAFWELQLNVK
jgi:hypothetical protein